MGDFTNCDGGVNWGVDGMIVGLELIGHLQEILPSIARFPPTL